MSLVSTFQPQDPVAPLNLAAQQALTDLCHAQASRKRLAAGLNDAAKRLTEVAGQINDRGTDKRLRHAKLQARAEANEAVIDEQVVAEYEAFQSKVKDLTQKMDHGMRGIIDGQAWAENVPATLQSVAAETGALAEATQQQTQGPTPFATQRNRSGSDGDMDTDEPENTPLADAEPPDPSDAPIALLRSAFAEHTVQWQSKSLTERYANSNEYTGFYRTVYDAKFPGENAPPIPHASLWFADEDSTSLSPSRSQPRQARQLDDAEDSDVEIASERVSLKCPITLLPFTEPLTSTKCPHSFEKNAILDMLRQSSESLPFTAEQELEPRQIRDRRALERKKREISTPAVKCPVCSCTLTQADLKPDPVLLRKVKRFEAATKRQQNLASDSEEDDDEEAPRGTQRKPLGLGSSPARASARAELIKKERARSQSTLPQTHLNSQIPRTTFARRAAVGDLGEDDEDEDVEMENSF